MAETDKNKNNQNKNHLKNNKKMKGGEPFFIFKTPEIGILLLHGFTSTPHQFVELGEFLSREGITVYAPLLAGHGTHPDDLANTALKELLESVEVAFQKLKEKVKRIIIIGNSFGGNLAFYLATKFSNPDILGIISLGTPITLRWQKFIKLRLYTYGWFKKYYRKSRVNYKLDYTDFSDEVTYPVIPIASLRKFFYFIKKLTIPELKKIRVPTLIIQADADPVINPKSAQKIHENLGSPNKKIFWLNGNIHTVTKDEQRGRVFKKIWEFIEEVKE